MSAEDKRKEQLRLYLLEKKKLQESKNTNNYSQRLGEAGRTKKTVVTSTVTTDAIPRTPSKPTEQQKQISMSERAPSSRNRLNETGSNVAVPMTKLLDAPLKHPKAEDTTQSREEKLFLWKKQKTLEITRQMGPKCAKGKMDNNLQQLTSNVKTLIKMVKEVRQLGNVPKAKMLISEMVTINNVETNLIEIIDMKGLHPLVQCAISMSEFWIELAIIEEKLFNVEAVIIAYEKGFHLQAQPKSALPDAFNNFLLRLLSPTSTTKEHMTFELWVKLSLVPFIPQDVANFIQINYLSHITKEEEVSNETFENSSFIDPNDSNLSCQDIPPPQRQSLITHLTSNDDNTAIDQSTVDECEGDIVNTMENPQFVDDENENEDNNNGNLEDEDEDEGDVDFDTIVKIEEKITIRRLEEMNLDDDRLPTSTFDTMDDCINDSNMSNDYIEVPQPELKSEPDTTCTTNSDCINEETEEVDHHTEEVVEVVGDSDATDSEDEQEDDLVIDDANSNMFDNDDEKPKVKTIDEILDAKSDNSPTIISVSSVARFSSTDILSPVRDYELSSEAPSKPAPFVPKAVQTPTFNTPKSRLFSPSPFTNNNNNAAKLPTSSVNSPYKLAPTSPFKPIPNPFATKTPNSKDVPSVTSTSHSQTIPSEANANTPSSSTKSSKNTSQYYEKIAKKDDLIDATSVDEIVENLFSDDDEEDEEVTVLKTVKEKPKLTAPSTRTPRTKIEKKQVLSPFPENFPIELPVISSCKKKKPQKVEDDGKFGSVTVITTANTSNKERELLGSSKKLTSVRRSSRILQNVLSEKPTTRTKKRDYLVVDTKNDDTSWKKVLEACGNAFDPNPSLQNESFPSTLYITEKLSDLSLNEKDVHSLVEHSVYYRHDEPKSKPTSKKTSKKKQSREDSSSENSENLVVVDENVEDDDALNYSTDEEEEKPSVDVRSLVTPARKQRQKKSEIVTPSRRSSRISTRTPKV